jgi:hypothetical protein
VQIKSIYGDQSSLYYDNAFYTVSKSGTEVNDELGYKLLSRYNHLICKVDDTDKAPVQVPSIIDEEVQEPPIERKKPGPKPKSQTDLSKLL